MTLRKVLSAGVALATLSGCSGVNSDAEKAALGIVDSCGIVSIRTEALDAPEKHAWDLFLMLNHPAKDVKVARGEPDCSKKFGTPGSVSVWETWRMARTEVFLKDGSEPPEWNSPPGPDALFGKTPDLVPSPHAPPGSPNKMLLPTAGPRPAFDPLPNQGVFVGRGGIGETHMNRSTYDFIKENCLWSYDGLSRYSKAILDGVKPRISFRPESQEAKAVWVRFKPEDVVSGKHKSYYTATADGATYGLVSFHVLTKDIPNWFWATFHHKDNPENPDEETSTFPKPRELAGTVWENYVLGGTQTDFITPHGKPTKLSDHYIENGFTNSSCITCHASATGHPEPLRGPDGKLSRDSAGRIVADEELPAPASDRLGSPTASDFERNGKLYFAQTDFLFSIPFRAREEAAPPPARCIWKPKS
jgi:hypothetical protein